LHLQHFIRRTQPVLQVQQFVCTTNFLLQVQHEFRKAFWPNSAAARRFGREAIHPIHDL
jgi:hypothetical protein